MNFVFPYKKRTSDFEMIQSIRWIRMSFPKAKVFTIGDIVPGAENIPCKQFNNIRGVDVTNRILTFANQVGGEPSSIEGDRSGSRVGATLRDESVSTIE
jgi:hypothetical protein